MDAIQKFNIPGMPADSDYKNLPFGRKIEYRQKIQDFKNDPKTKKDWISIKGDKNANKEIKKFLKAVGSCQYYCKYNDSDNCRDDSFEIYYV